jgi:hypothetical protein
LARDVEVSIHEIHLESPSTIWPCISPFTTRRDSEKFYLEPLIMDRLL